MTTAPARVKFGTVKEQFDRARIALLFGHPFFSSLLHMLKPVEKPSLPTMATDGVHLFYNPTFVEQTVPAQLIGVLAHEVMHPALKHHLRRNGRDPKMWNKACDYVINPIIRKAGLQLPDDVLDDSRFYGMDSETVYGILEREAQEQGNSGSSSSGGSSSTGGAGSPPDPSDFDDTQDEESTDAEGDQSYPGDYGSVMDYAGPERSLSQMWLPRKQPGAMPYIRRIWPPPLPVNFLLALVA